MTIASTGRASTGPASTGHASTDTAWMGRPAQPLGYGEFRRGWQVVLASLLGIGLGLAAMPFYTIGMFAPHLAAEFGWSMGEIMAGITVTTLVVLVAGPAVGVLAVRLGVRRVALTSLVLFGVAFMAMALNGGSLLQYYLTYGLVSLLGAGTLPITWTKAVNQWFDVRKGLALGISMMGTGLFGILGKPYLAWLIAEHGWRGGYVGLGLLPILIAFPVAFFLFRDTDTHPDAVVRTLVPGGFTLGEALREWRFWLIAFALVPISYALAGPVPNLEIILKSGGVAPGTVLALTPLVGLSAIIGRIFGGWLLDRLWAPGISFVILALPAISCWLLTGTTLDYPTAAAAIVLIGFALGIEYDVVAYFVARYFGMRSYAAIYGLLYVCFALGSGLGPLAFARDYDLHGNYSFSLTTAAFALVAAAAAFLALGRYRQFADEDIPA
ncbi:MFS transporter [Sphingomonas sp. OK281]|uniref:MFS transporter n=1 Tax=Sphingomonas sp. OK281 TaxID=1881067 RepID=UPI0008E483FE|nr:MFS transporter [Sphingomonas sp. OK281]SFO02915.1 Predicted arabinose efflux permease, MFS family [Sphingomonas sp. OK281]